jgi:hypothetical protein
MKHIIRKPLREWKLDADAVSALENSGASILGKTISPKLADKFVGYLHTQDDKFIQTFPFTRNGNTYHIVEPHPVTLYFNGAQFFLKHLNERKTLLLMEIEKPIMGLDVRKQLDATYTFFSNFSMFATFLYNSLEAFVNYIIPEKFEFKVEGKRNTEIWNKDQIQRHFSTEKKLWEVLPIVFDRHIEEVKEKDFRKTILKLKDCRDEITHTKYGGDSHPNGYKKLFVMALEFDYNAALSAVAEIINFYEPNLIEECGCGVDH